jgi:prepilin-type processing-associated H-X9-DG protein
MKRTALLLAVITVMLAGTSLGFCQPPIDQPRPPRTAPPAPVVDQPPAPPLPPLVLPTTPDGVITAFIKAWHEGDERMLTALVAVPNQQQDAAQVTDFLLPMMTVLGKARRPDQPNGDQHAMLAALLPFAGFLERADPAIPQNIKVAGKEATIEATVQFRQKFVLVQEDGQWKIDLVRTLGLDPAVVKTAQVRQACQSHLKQLALAAIMYSNDWDESLPAPDQWSDQILPYARAKGIMQCPSDPGHEFGYAMNAKLRGVHTAEINDPAQIVLFFDSSLGVKNAADAGESLPRPGRHEGGNDVAFCDGHVRWVPDAELAKLRFDPKAP